MTTLETLNPDLRARVDAFVTDLTALVRRAAIAAVEERLGGSTPSPAKTSPAKTPTPKPAKPAPTSRPKGHKRDPKVLEGLVEKLFAYIKAHPARRIEQIGKGMEILTKDLTLPIKKLLKAKRITRRGEKRSTTYSAAAGK